MPKPESAPAGHDVNDLLTQCEPLVVRLVKLRLRGRPADVLDDVAQEVRLVLWRDVLPKYNPSHGLITTYAFVCINNTITRQLRRLDRRPPSVPLDFNTEAPDAGADRAIEQLADLILSTPESYLSDLGAAILRAVTQNPGEPTGAVAERLGLDPQTLWNNLSKARKQISRLVEASSYAA